MQQNRKKFQNSGLIKSDGSRRMNEEWQKGYIVRENPSGFV